MARRELLSPSQRKMILALPQAHETRLIARFYTFSDQDIAMIRQQRGNANRLGYAVVLAYLRYPGKRWTPNDEIPDHILHYIAEQLEISPKTLDYYSKSREGTRRGHVRRIQEQFDYQTFSTDRHPLQEWLLPFALSTGNGYILVEEAIRELRYRRIILPALSTIEAICWQVYQTAQEHIFTRLTHDLSETQQSSLRSVLNKQDENSPLTTLGWLRQPPSIATPNNFLAIINRLQMIEAIGLSPQLRHAIHPNRLIELYEDGKRFSAWRLGRFVDDRRTFSTLVAYLIEQHMHLTDQALLMHTKLIQQILKRSHNKQGRQFQRDGKAINRKLHQYVKLGQLLIEARQTKQGVFQTIDETFSWDTFIKDIEQAETLTRPKNFDFLTLVGNRYSYIRRFSPHLLQAFTFKGDEENAGLRQAIQLICDVDTGERKDLPEWTPTDFVDAGWKPYVFQDGELQRRYYELCVLDKLRDGLRSGDIWVEGSQQYRHLKSFLIPDEQWQMMLDADVIPVAVPRNPLTYLRARADLLHEQLQRVDEGLANDEFEGVEWVDDRLKIARTTLDVPDDMRQIRRAVYKLLPRIRITDLLLEVDATVGFTKQFTHLQTGDPFDNSLALCTILLAGAINLGIEKMALVSHHNNYDRLAWIMDWFIRDDTYAKALVQLTHFQMSNPFAYHRGSGTQSSSDAQYFPTGNFQSALTSRNPYYDKESGIAFYTHVSDQHSPFFTQVISTRIREAPYMLNGLLHHETQLDIHEHATDTKGFTDHVFALCTLLGFRFAPRIRGFSKLKLYPIKHKKYYPTLKPMLGSRINTRLVFEDWLEMLHITSSLRLGTVTPPVFLQRLGQYPRQNRWAKTLKEIGHIERTLFSTYWIQDKLLRQRVHQALFKGEARNALSRAVCIYRLGRIHDRSLQDQQYRASALNLVVSAITVWNTIYIEKAVEHLHNKGWEITDKHLEHLTPLGWEHISLTGDYIWNPNISTSLTNLRDLRT